MKKIVAAGVFVVALVELMAFAILDRELVPVVVGVIAALVLLTLRLYLMREPSAGVWGDAFGDMRARPVSEHALDIEVLGVVPGRAGIESVMSGWEQKMLEPDGIAWLRDRVQHAADHMHDAPATPSDVLPDDKD